MKKDDLDYIDSLSESDAIKDIRDFPVQLIKKMVEKQIAQENKGDVTIFQNNRIATKENGGFNWSETEQGFDFWYRVIHHSFFDEFFDKFYRKKIEAVIHKKVFWFRNTKNKKINAFLARKIMNLANTDFIEVIEDCVFTYNGIDFPMQDLPFDKIKEILMLLGTEIKIKE